MSHTPSIRTIAQTSPARLRPRILNEYGRLRDVIVSRGDTLVDASEEDHYLEKFGGQIAQERPHHPETGAWKADAARAQHARFLALLEEQGVRLHHPRDIGGAIYSLFTRDIGFVVHDLFVHARMGDPIRSWERYGLSAIVDTLPQVAEPAHGTVEGGDIIVHGNTVFVGITRHSTDEEGCQALRAILAPRGVRVVPIRCRDNVLHLDCRFAPIGTQTALIHRDDLHPLDVLYLEGEFTLIDVPRDEVDRLATNVLPLASDAVVIDARNAGLRRRLRKERIEPLPVEYDEVTKMWGAFRCSTLPLVRDPL